MYPTRSKTISFFWTAFFKIAHINMHSKTGKKIPHFPFIYLQVLGIYIYLTSLPIYHIKT